MLMLWLLFVVVAAVASVDAVAVDVDVVVAVAVDVDAAVDVDVAVVGVVDTLPLFNDDDDDLCTHTWGRRQGRRDRGWAKRRAATAAKVRRTGQGTEI